MVEEDESNPAGWAWPAVHSQQWCGEHKPKTGQTGQDK
jgi:hypothetical protein